MALLLPLISLFLLFQVGPAENAKILSLLPLWTKSHYYMFQALFESLALKGHEIDIVTPLDVTARVPGINITRIEYPNIFSVFATTPLKEMRTQPVHTTMQYIFGGNLNICDECFKKEEFKKIRDTKKKYDLIILEIFVLDCLYGYAHALNAPVVSVTTSVDLPWGTNKIGNPDNPAYIMNYFSPFVPEMTLWERLSNVRLLVQTKLHQYWFHKQQEIEAKKMFGDDLPPLNDLIANSSLFIVNSHFTMNSARPSVPNVIEAGGLHITEPKPLKEDLSKFIGNSKFIYFSLGSMVKLELIHIEILQNFCDVFKDLKYKVLWKTKKSELPKELKVPENVLATEWMPQMDILCHPNILLFITHNGLMSTQEAVYCGVPMLSIPTFADQFLNAQNMERKGVSKVIEVETISKQDLYTTMKQLLENPEYKRNAKTLSEQFKDRPRKPIEEATYWIEYVLKHKGAPQLRSRAAHLAWYQYYLVDVALVISSCLAITLFVVYRTIRSFLKKPIHHNKKKLS